MSIFIYDQKSIYGWNVKRHVEEGRREGRESGLREGEENTKRIFKLAQAGKTPKEIAEICEVSVEKVQHIFGYRNALRTLVEKCSLWVFTFCKFQIR